MLITALVFILIVFIIGIAAWKITPNKEMVEKEAPPSREHPYTLKKAVNIEAAQELHPFEETKESNAAVKMTMPNKRNHIHIVPQNADQKIKSPVRTAPRKVEEKVNKPIQAVPHIVEEKVNKPVQTAPHNVDEKIKNSIQAVPRIEEKPIPQIAVSPVNNAIPVSLIKNVTPHSQVLNQNTSSPPLIPLSLEKQLDNIEVTEYKLQSNVYNTLVKQLNEASDELAHINEQIKLIGLLNYIEDELTKISKISEHK